MKRRTLLKRGVWGGVLLSVGGVGFWMNGRGQDAFAVLQAIARRVVPKRAGFPSVDEVDVAKRAEHALSLLDPAAVRELKQLLQLFESPLMGFRARPFTALSPEDQDAQLRDWMQSRLAIKRTGYQVLRSLAVACYYGSPLTFAAVGYPGPPSGFHQAEAP